MELPDYYKALKVDENADLETIKKAFRREIALYHPDKNKDPNARAHFELLVEAFNILSHPEKRKSYDELRRQTALNKPIIVTPKQEKQYKEWKKESKKKSDEFRFKDLADLLLLDFIIDTGFSDFFSETDSMLGDLGESLGDVFDLF